MVYPLIGKETQQDQRVLQCKVTKLDKILVRCSGDAFGWEMCPA